MPEYDSFPEHGVESGATRVVAYQPGWVAAFQAEQRRITEVLSNDLRSIPLEHVGSTAVPGLAAKPLIDMMAGIHTENDRDLFHQTLLDLGYEYKGSPFTPDDHIFMLTDGGWLHTHKVHLTTYDGAEWRRKLSFRDHLIANPDVAVSYGQLKVKLARRFPGDRREYQRHKGNFITNVLKSLE
jgi:GrpB-like predicted nucleotidyltransferase (UPF0157 family)